MRYVAGGRSLKQRIQSTGVDMVGSSSRGRLVAAAVAAALVVVGLTTGVGAASASSCTSRIITDHRIFTGTAGGPQQATNAAIWNARAAGYYGSFTRLSTVCG
ncbi:hypothetical protein TPB0596_00580 [Tsukamurella pulmonis]|nr:hypothetical protein TPB0596_00580 [Tsukamurella pulmonis]